MGVNRKIKFDYFQVYFIDNKGDDYLFDLRLWIDKVKNIPLESRNKVCYNDEARLDKIFYDAENDFWFLNFARLRIQNPPLKGKINTVLEPINLDDDEYIGEDITILYDNKNYIIMVQRNLHSLSPSGIENYINLMWQDQNGTIEFRPIILNDTISRLSKAESIKKFTVRFANLEEFVPSENIGIRAIIDKFKDFDAIIGEINIGIGRNNKKRLDNSKIIDTIKELIIYRNNITKAQVAFKETDDGKVELIDLFEHKAHDYIIFSLQERQSIGFEYIIDKMKERYIERRAKLVENLKVGKVD
ncbi:DUF6731 family protein [Caloramator proteoclasticus]|uniref:Uncharacterized protein n=1 Tax=Caloramator proteoclasticus DSM 10124 TaxID=1121262 RepID=A0A1M5A198_9CLOT|nr:DUF6731 family protein [Caloramator proteoclasticus]SHF23907.1 hypothetical protein SAMN02746091_02069 [Caloramator proteoclasticus DSM 10124]